MRLAREDWGAPGIGFASGLSTFVLLGLLSLALWRYTDSITAEQQKAEFDRAASDIIDEVESRLGIYEQFLRAGAALFPAYGNVSRSQWNTFVGNLNLSERLPGIQGIGFAEFVAPSEKQHHISEVRAEGFPDYRIYPEYDRPSYTSIVYLEPFDERNQRAFGYDMMTEPVRRDAMERARDSGTTARTGKVTLVQENGIDVQNGFLMYFPVYRPGTSPTTPDDRRRSIIGYVYSPFRMADFIKGVLGSAQRPVRIEIYDGSAVAGDRLLYSDGSQPADKPKEDRLTHIATRRSYGRPWTYRVSAPASVAVLAYQEPFAVLVGSLLASLLASLVVGSLAFNRTQTSKMNARLIEDIGRRKQLEQQLVVSREKFRTLFDRNPQPMWAFNRSSLQFVAVNDTAVAKYGYSRDEFMKMTLRDIRPEQDVPELLEEAKRDFERDGRKLWRHVLRDGRQIYVEVHLSQIELEGREVTLVVPNDITERIAAQRALAASEARLQAIIDAAPLMITVKNGEGRYLLANRKFCEFHAASPEHLIGRKPIDILPPEKAKRELARDRKALTSPRIQQFEDSSEFENGERQYELSIHFPIRAPGMEAEAVGTIVADLTELKMVEQQLQHLQKLESVGELTGGIAHDFNNLLTVIIANGEDLRSDFPSSGPAVRQLDMLLHAAFRGAELVRSLLAFARNQPLEPKTFDVKQLVQWFSRMVSRVLPATIQIDVHVGKAELFVTADPGLLNNALLNLCVNARDAMPTGGTLSIVADRIILDDETARRRTRLAAGEYVSIEVSDTGTGMPPEVIARAFEPFFTTKEVGKGTGLGLSMVYGFIRQSGGDATIEAEVDKGTTIKLYLPISAKPAAAEAQDFETAVAGKGMRVLLVEDDDYVAASISMRLTRLHHHVVRASNAAEALSMLQRGSQFDVLLSDVVMPGIMSGLDLAAEVRRRWPGMRVIVSSGYHEALVGESRASLPTGIGVLLKPYSAEELRRALAALSGSA
jgi:PAS domain S-box-containing protein